MSNRKSLYVILGVLCFSVVMLSVAFAALSTTLTINFGNVTQTVQTWNIGYNLTPGNVINGVEGGTTEVSGRSCGQAVVTRNNVAIANVSLSKPEDSCYWAIPISNTGTIAAELASIAWTAPTSTTCSPNSGASMTCGNITYKLTTDVAGSTLVTTSNFGKLNSSSGKTVYLYALYNANTVNSSAITQKNAILSLIFNQA